MENRSGNFKPVDGYDLPVYGLDNGLFYALHVPSVACLVASFVCAVIAIIVSFRRHWDRAFFSWRKCDRFIVYLAICDGTFNFPHAADHLHVTISRDHVHPRLLCELYGFVTAVFATAQNILVGLIAVDIFALMYFHKKLNFGRYDWILLLITFGTPAVGGVVTWVLGTLGPNAVICLTDGVNGRTIFIMFFTIPLLTIIAMNSVLYLLTWMKIRSEVRLIRKNMGQDPPNRKTARRAAKSMSLFVAAFFIQWWAAGLYGAWGLFGDIPNIVLHTSTTFTNIGGILNLCVFILVTRNRSHRDKARAFSSKSFSSTRAFSSKSFNTRDTVISETVSEKVESGGGMS